MHKDWVMNAAQPGLVCRPTCPLQPLHGYAMRAYRYGSLAGLMRDTCERCVRAPLGLRLQHVAIAQLPVYHLNGPPTKRCKTPPVPQARARERVCWLLQPAAHDWCGAGELLMWGCFANWRYLS